MAEYIEREEVKRQLRIWIQEAEEDMAHDVADCFRDCIDLLDDVPAADVVEVRHGRWVSSEQYNGRPECPVCFYVTDEKTNYCPHCGAKMDKD